MPLSEIRIGKEQIQATEVYKNMNFIQKQFVKKYNNVRSINHALNVIKNLGYEQWQKQSNPSYINLLIINEIVKK